MSILLQKGLDYNAEYASVDFPVLTADWTGSVSFYTTYPGTATFTKAMTKDGNKFLLNLTIAEILNLLDGVYFVVATLTNPVLMVTVSSLEYATVSAINVSPATKCKIFGTIIKNDGTPAGRAGTALGNTAAGTSLLTTWIGVPVRVSHPVRDKDTGMVVGIETTETTTNAAGYFEIYVLQGLNVLINCTSLGAPLPLDTTALTEYDIFASI